MQIRPTGIMDAASVQSVARQKQQADFAKLLEAEGEKLKNDKDDKKLRQTCQELEAVFLEMMMKEMRNTVPKSGMMDMRNQELFQSMLDTELTRDMAKAGGIGLADMMYRQLSQQVTEPLAKTADLKKTAK